MQRHRMAPIMLCTVVFLLSALEFVAAQSSCRGRCGSEYYRGYMCQCDYSCLSYGECCKDFESQCTTKSSCKGRCGESFRRGRLCNCDSDCLKYNQCCPDYEMHCDAEDDLKALEPPTSYDEFFETGVENLETSPIPDNSSGPEPLIVTSTQPTQGSQIVDSTTATVMVVSEAETTSLKESSNSTVQLTNGDAPADSTEATAQETTEENISNSTLSTSEPPSPTTVLKSETVGPAEVTSSPSAEPVITSAPVSTLSSITENTQTTSVPPSPPPDLTATAEESTTTTTTTTTTTLVPPSSPTTTTTTTTLVPPSSPTTPVPPSTTASSSEPDAETTITSLNPAATQEDTTKNSTQEDPLPASTEPTSPQGTEPTTKPQDQNKPDKPLPSKPESKPQDPQQNNNDQQGYQADDSNDPDLCSGRPVSGVTTLRNGTTVVFRGHYFWFLDMNRVPGPAQGITQVWGVPSPIDTVFTRCNCQGKTYIFKGGRYWRFENDALDAGYPRAVKTGFDGLQGHITAALSVPQYNQRGESVYFFKRGGFVQKYSYQFGTSPSCGRKTQYIVYQASRRAARQAVSVLEPAINIRTSWRGFPTTVTAAVSIPSQTQPDGYKYYVFSRSKSYSVRMDSGRPAIAAPSANTVSQNEVFKCPKKV
ncbi:proteoglycan 4b isoform X2 [Gouania willdenowi]|uniref:proteoglycan 4b isoform X2 n=1 Tax=Gouania willdenowi TaxID=441366 RepID=UPI0010568B3F|nr:proteoglycan 4-like isoform X2 [Gouania willdenowi]